MMTKQQNFKNLTTLMAYYKKGEMPVHLGRYIDRKLVFFTLSKIEPRPLKVYKKKKNDNRKNSSSY